jgi:hypothetical protein
LASIPANFAGAPMPLIISLGILALSCGPTSSAYPPDMTGPRFRSREDESSPSSCPERDFCRDAAADGAVGHAVRVVRRRGRSPPLPCLSAVARGMVPRSGFQHPHRGIHPPPAKPHACSDHPTASCGTASPCTPYASRQGFRTRRRHPTSAARSRRPDGRQELGSPPRRREGDPSRRALRKRPGRRAGPSITTLSASSRLAYTPL